MSTSKAEEGFQFDCGTHFIASPYTEDFRSTLSAWENNGWTKLYGKLEFEPLKMPEIWRLLRRSIKFVRTVWIISHFDFVCNVERKQCESSVKDSKSQLVLFLSTNETEACLRCQVFDSLIARDRNIAAPFWDNISETRLMSTLRRFRCADVPIVQSSRSLAAIFGWIDQLGMEIYSAVSQMIRRHQWHWVEWH